MEAVAVVTAETVVRFKRDGPQQRPGVVTTYREGVGDTIEQQALQPLLVHTQQRWNRGVRRDAHSWWAGGGGTSGASPQCSGALTTQQQRQCL
jgi:hypothetical protein